MSSNRTNKLFVKRSRGGEVADLGEFPWMALLGYKQNNIDIIEFLCGGTIITETYILTAGHCLEIGENHQIVLARLGEHDLRSTIDCVTFNGEKRCADPHVDIPVENYVRHSNYDSNKLKNDIALVRIKGPITFSGECYIIHSTNMLTIWKEFGKQTPSRTKVYYKRLGKRLKQIGLLQKVISPLYVSGKLGGSPLLQYASVRVWEQSSCNKVIPPQVQPISENQLCANGRKEDACKGDSGGPLSNATLDLDEELRNFQIGIVSFASTMTCGVEELPPIYTRIDKYLMWIMDNIK
ncbi:hypothetical protein NQ317_010725 [Molorchus minor]|uniref:Peptidase S1 domain-containing protein n=1 Tax=Molorchus minor TaxID=1323400 RepID=A0ABQ9K7G5_9CUCU|nr:hypothetical protein NQ317_010725 [Molorchus minor]